MCNVVCAAIPQLQKQAQRLILVSSPEQVISLIRNVYDEKNEPIVLLIELGHDVEHVYATQICLLSFCVALNATIVVAHSSGEGNYSEIPHSGQP